MAKSLLLSLLLHLILLPSQCSHGLRPNPTPASAYDELRVAGFPAGLLPAGILRYSLNRTSGDFAVDFGGKCRVTLPPDNYLAAYSPRVTGKLLDGKIKDLDGIRVRAFFRWWSITGIRSSGDDLVFEVGVASAKYPARNFGESPECEGREGKGRSPLREV